MQIISLAEIKSKLVEKGYDVLFTAKLVFKHDDVIFGNSSKMGGIR